jgi:uncharacterized protein
MSYPLFPTLHLFAALVFISTVLYEVLFLESIRKQLPAKVKVLLEQGISRRARQLMPWVLVTGARIDLRKRCRLSRPDSADQLSA